MTLCGHPRCSVFNVYFYVNTNPQLDITDQEASRPRGLTERAALEGSGSLLQAARIHWATIGLDAGLQGCGSFHALQYLGVYIYQLSPVPHG